MFRGFAVEAQDCERLATLTLRQDLVSLGSPSLELVKAREGDTTVFKVTESGETTEVELTGNKVVVAKGFTFRHFGWYDGLPKIGVDRCL
jgi:hypothetical protein